MDSSEPADRQWEEFKADAADALRALDQIYVTVPAFMESSFDPQVQRRLREFLDSDVLSCGTEAFLRIAARPAPMVDEV